MIIDPSAALAEVANKLLFCVAMLIRVQAWHPFDDSIGIYIELPMTCMLEAIQVSTARLRCQRNTCVSGKVTWQKTLLFCFVAADSSCKYEFKAKRREKEKFANVEESWRLDM